MPDGAANLHAVAHNLRSKRCANRIPHFSLSIFQLEVKKRCEWWCHKYIQKMSTHWRQNACLYACCIAFLLGMLIMFHLGLRSAHKGQEELPQSTHPLSNSPPATPATLHPRRLDNDTSTDHEPPDGLDDLDEEEHSAFVMPTKVYNYSLSEADLIYESKRNSDINSFLKGKPNTPF